MSEFTHLHVHTHYSLLDGVNKIDKLFDKVKNSGMDSLAITDHGIMYGVAEFWKMSKDFGVKPILGCEIYVAPEDRKVRQEVNGLKYYHLILLAKNFTGYKNLVKIVTAGHLEGFYYRPRVDRELLKKHSEGLICSTACLAGPVARHITRNELDKAEDWVKFLKDTYKQDFYLEVQRNGYGGGENFDESLMHVYTRDEIETIKMQIKVNKKLREYSEKYSIPLIATTDAHYLNKEDKDVQTVLFCIKDGLKIDDPRSRKGYVGTYIKTPEEMKEIFSDDLTLLENTQRIVESVEQFSIAFDRIQPKFWNLKEHLTAQEELKRESFAGAIDRYGEKEGRADESTRKQIRAEIMDGNFENITKVMSDELIERINYELQVIHDKGYDDYFLVVSDIMKYAAKEGILMGVRGSVAGSVVAHCLYIVEVDPITWELYFERFLNPERPSPPDIDMDIQDSRRDEIIRYVEEKYGKDAVAAIVAIGRLKTKAAIRDVARVMGIDLQIADKLSKMVHVLFGKVYPIQKMIDTDPEFASIINSDPRLQELASVVQRIEVMGRHASVHACGHLITPGPITEYVPLQMEPGGGKRTVVQFEFPWIEELGLMKFDFLGLRTLTIIHDAIELINKKYDINLNFFGIPNNDKETYELFSRGETIGVFQFESPPMQQYLRELQPETQEDICFLVAAYRPGPMKYIPDYIARKHGKQETTYLAEDMKAIVGKTYGFAIYQEQVIKIAVDLAGYTMGAADVLRRAMGKKKLDVMQKEEAIFKEGIKKKGLSDEVADGLWQYLLPFADYGFNKAHAAGYAVLAYKCAYLKAHYPLEFMTALMHSDLGDTDRIVIDINESKRLGFKVLPPDVNKSNVDFTTENEDSIRFGLGAIKNVGNKVCEFIIEARREKGEFTSLDDLVAKVDPANLNKRSIESLIMGGALDSFGDRNALLAIVPEVFEKCEKAKKSKEMGQTDLFSFGEESKDDEIRVSATPLPQVDSASDAQKINWEKEMLGLFVSTHPLQNFNWILLKNDYTTLDKIDTLPVEKQVKFVAIMEVLKVIKTKKDGKKMAVCDLCDLTGKSSGVIFPRTFEKYEQTGILKESTPLIFTAKVNEREGKKSLIIEEVDHANVIQKPNKVKINICGVNDASMLEEIKKAFEFTGDTEVLVEYGSRSNLKTKTLKADIDNEIVVTTFRKWITN
jgi:DNA polymerase-3 subunit alpha